jgi:hypothetical protein
VAAPTQPTQPTQQPPPEWGQTTLPTPPPRRRRRRGGRILLVVAAVGVGLLLAGGLLGNDQSANPTTTQPASKPSNSQDRTGPAKLAIGQAGITHDVLGNQTAQITASGPSYPAAQQFLEPGRGHWVVFDVDVKALRDNITSPQFYVLVDGEKFDPDYMYPGNDHMLQFSDLQAGQRQSGTVGFDLPAEHGTLVVPGGDGEPQLEWQF